MIVIWLGLACTIGLLAWEGAQDLLRRWRGLPPEEPEDNEDW